MIKTKNLVILGVALVVLLGVSLLQRTGHRKATSQSSVSELLPAEVVPADLSRITLGLGDNAEAVVLSNTPTGWTVDTAWNAAASQDRIDTLVRNLTGLTGEYRSNSAEVLADYGLADTSAVHIRAYDPKGEVVMALEVGNKPERSQGNFVRQPDNDKVYVSQKNILAQLGIYGGPELPQGRYFLDLQAVKENRLDVDSVVVDGLNLSKVFATNPPDSTHTEPTVDRNTWEWELAGKSSPALAKSKVDAVLNTLEAIRANDLVDPQADLATYGLDKPDRRAEIHLQDGRVIGLNFGDSREAVGKAPAGIYMQVDGQDNVWVVTEYTVKNIFKGLDDLKADAD